MIEDSSYLKGRVGIYTTMLGHKASLKASSAMAKRMGATRVVETEFFQGTTIRWGLAWSFTERDARFASHRIFVNRSSEQMAKAVKDVLLAVNSTTFEWDDKASGPWVSHTKYCMKESCMDDRTSSMRLYTPWSDASSACFAGTSRVSSVSAWRASMLACSRKRFCHARDLDTPCTQGTRGASSSFK
jgi:hypothetical protein